MTAEKFILLIFSLAVSIICIGIYIKSSAGQKKYLFSALFGSMGMGASSLFLVWILSSFFGKLIYINLCTILIALTGSIPAVAAMLFLNII